MLSYFIPTSSFSSFLANNEMWFLVSFSCKFKGHMGLSCWRVFTNTDRKQKWTQLCYLQNGVFVWWRHEAFGHFKLSICSTEVKKSTCDICPLTRMGVSSRWGSSGLWERRPSCWQGRWTMNRQLRLLFCSLAQAEANCTSNCLERHALPAETPAGLPAFVHQRWREASNQVHHISNGVGAFKSKVNFNNQPSKCQTALLICSSLNQNCPPVWRGPYGRPLRISWREPIIVLASSVVFACYSLEPFSVASWTQLPACDCARGSACPFPCLTSKLCWCQMSSRWQLDVGRSILTGSPVSPAFCSPSKAVLTLPPSRSSAVTLWTFFLLDYL